MVEILERSQNSVLVSWEQIFQNPCSGCRYSLQMYDKSKNWHPIYWGRKTKWMVENLEPCTCYDLRVKINCDVHGTTTWTEFKITTIEEDFCTRHLSRAVEFGKTAMIRKIVAKRPKLLEIMNKRNRTPLIEMTEKGDTQIAAFLINLGANVNAQTMYTQRTALMVAMFHRRLPMVQLLLDKGANIHLRDVNEMNVVHYAVDANFAEGLKLIFKYLPDINAQDSQGWTPIMRAVILESSDEIIDLLRENGATLEKMDNNGFDFYKHCKISKRPNIISNEQNL